MPGEAVGFPEPERPPACEGDACQGTPAPLIDQTPASLTFTGPGDQAPESVKVAVKKVTKKKAVKCGKGFTKQRNRCVKNRKSKRAKKAGHGGRTKS